MRMTRIFTAGILLALSGLLFWQCKDDNEKKSGFIVESMAFSEEEIALKEGEMDDLYDYLIVEPESIVDTLTIDFESSNKEVASVTSLGKVLANSEGRCTVTASAYGKTAEIDVRVMPLPITDFDVPSGTLQAAVNVPMALGITMTPAKASQKRLNVSVQPESASLKFENKVWVFETEVTGLYTITVSYGEISKTFNVQAKVIEVNTVSLNKSTALIEVGDNLTLTADVLPENASDKTLTWTSSDPTVASVSNGVCRGLKKGQTTITATASNGVKATCTLKVTDEDLSQVHLFSVGAGKQVRFSPGNLQFCKDANVGALHFRFAPNQYDKIGSTNSQIAYIYYGWLDLMGSGTDVNPFNYSTSNLDYTYVYNHDWGYLNKIKYGSDEYPAGQWRTPTKNELVFLLNTRPRATDLYGVARVNGVCGLILLPDDWTSTTGVTFTAGTSATSEDEATSANYASVNDFTASQWEALEADGAVFLPAAGQREGGTVNTRLCGEYWTSTQFETLAAQCTLYFTPSTVRVGDDYTFAYWHTGCSVRLVQDF